MKSVEQFLNEWTLDKVREIITQKGGNYKWDLLHLRNWLIAVSLQDEGILFDDLGWDYVWVSPTQYILPEWYSAFLFFVYRKVDSLCPMRDMKGEYLLKLLDDYIVENPGGLAVEER